MIRHVFSCRAAALIAGASVLLPAMSRTAHADLTYCNQSSFYILSAVAYVENKEWRSRGWMALRPGECRVVMKGDIRRHTTFTYAEAHPGHRGEIRTWEGRTQFCVGGDRFDISGREDCEGRGHGSRKFARLENSDTSPDWTMEFRELRAYNLQQSRIAGIQRLLFDIGYNAGAIDGDLGRRTQLAIRAFQGNHGLRVDGEPSLEVLDKLLENAAAIQMESGYSLCNKTGFELWVAVGFSRGNNWISRGWWKVPAGNCVKPIKDRLSTRFFYTYAEAQRSNGERIIWGGDHPLCTADVLFDITGNEACEARGYDTTGFQRVDTEGRSGWQQDFIYEDRP